MAGALQWLLSRSLGLHLAVGFLVRVVLVVVSELVDRSSSVKYTDIDYDVLSDAAAHVAHGGSPFDRATYRYTPLLAYVVLPTQILPAAGKLLFSIADVFIGYLLFRQTAGHRLSTVSSWPCVGLVCWLYNPIVVALSTRGSPECIVMLTVLAVLFAAEARSPATGALLALAVHVKLFPIIFALPIFLSFGEKAQLWRMLPPTRAQWTLVLTFGAVLTMLTLVFYLMYVLWQREKERKKG